MTIPLGKVKALCTDSETNLVQASRRPTISKLTAAQARRHRERAKKLVDKWRDQSRKQARSNSDQKGFGEKAKRSEMKVQIFEDALKSFDEHLAKLEKADSGSGTPKKKAASGKSSATTSATAKKSSKKKLPAATRKSNAAKVKAAVKKQQPPTTAKKQSATEVLATEASTELNLDPADRRAAETAAKQAKVDESGLTSRTQGHVSARERRATASRDS